MNLEIIFVSNANDFKFLTSKIIDLMIDRDEDNEMKINGNDQDNDELVWNFVTYTKNQQLEKMAMSRDLAMDDLSAFFKMVN